MSTVRLSLCSWRDKHGSAVLFFGDGASRRVGILVKSSQESLVASPFTSHGGSITKKVPWAQEFRQLCRLCQAG